MNKLPARTLGYAVLGALAIVLAALAAGMSFHGASNEDASLQGDDRPSRSSWQEKFRRTAEIPYPPQNPYSKVKSELGRKLFFDPLLSRSQTISCATCHDPQRSWSDNLPKAVGVETLPLRTPTLLNVAWTPILGWDGHFPDLEAVAFGPMTSPNNMNMSEELVLERVSSKPAYVDAFAAAFDDGKVTRRNIELALATYERSIVSGKAPFDRWIAGDEQAIGPAAKRGFDLFVGKANCVSCHSGWTFTDASFHDIGTARGDDLGRGRLFPTSTKLRYAFKTPTLRDVARRAPYMHDGSVKTLEEVIALYDRGGIDRPSRSAEISPLKLGKQEKDDLIAFLQTLNGDRPGQHTDLTAQR